jgi:uncharacterized protein YndB with AHSA1/START domain
MRTATASEPATMEIELQQRFRTSPERIFRAWTSPVALRERWCPAGWVAGEIEIDLRIGGAYSIAMSRVGGGGTVTVRGQFVEVRPPERLVYTWRWEGVFAQMPETLVTVELHGEVRGEPGAAEDETMLTLRHENFADFAIRQQHRSGWIAACDRLDDMLTPAVVPLKRPAAR